ncbi:predicted protein [Postia placenta Mad-698-R]|nr:predicted protein [Postia placenta Mad-698-R]
MEIAIHPSTAGLSAIWDNAVAKFKLNTEIDLYDPRAIVQPHSTTLEDVEGPNSLLTAFQHRREHSAKLKYQRALLLVKLMPVLGDVEWLLRTEDRDEEDLADEERICIAINALFDRLPTIPRPDVQLTLTARNALDNILISYIDLMGVKAPPEKSSSMLDRVLQDHTEIITMTTNATGEQMLISFREELLSQLRAYWKEVEPQPDERARIQKLIVDLSDRIMRLQENRRIGKQVAARGKHAAHDIVVELLDELSSITGRIKPKLTTSVDTRSIIRIKVQILMIVGIGVKVLLAHKTVLHITTMIRSASSLFAWHEGLQSAIEELKWLVDRALPREPLPDRAENPHLRFQKLWQDALERYAVITESDVQVLEAFTRVDTLPLLEAALAEKNHVYRRGANKTREARHALKQIGKFIKIFMRPAAKLAEPHFAGAKVVASALSKVVEAVDRSEHIYQPMLDLLNKLSSFVNRLQVFLRNDIPEEMNEPLVRILCEILVIFGLLTKHLKKGFMARIFAEDEEVKRALHSLQGLIEDEALMTATLAFSETQKMRQRMSIFVSRGMRPVWETTDAIEGQTEESAPNVDETYRRRGFPERPSLFVGRGRDKKKIIAAILECVPITVLGAAGIGKTTLVLEALHDNRVCECFTARYFVSCDNIKTVEELRIQIASVLGIPAQFGDEQLSRSILIELGQEPAILFLDNFEALFDIPTSLKKVTRELDTLAGVETLSLVVAMRGTEAPAESRLRWTRHLLQPMTLPEGARLFRKVAGIVNIDDPNVNPLVRLVDSVPLAVVLLAHEANQSGRTDTQALWDRLQADGIASLQKHDDAHDESFDLFSSIDVSVNSPRMNQNAKVVMALLAILPNGLPHSSDLLEELQSAIPHHIDLVDSLTTLCRVALAYIDDAGGPQRYRMLSPIREYCHDNPELQVSGELQKGLVQFYLNFLNARDTTTIAGREVVPPELPNIEYILLSSVPSAPEAVINLSPHFPKRSGTPLAPLSEFFRRLFSPASLRHTRSTNIDSSIIRAAVLYTDWMLHLGTPSPSILEKWIPLLSEESLSYQNDLSSSLLGNCLSTLAKTYVFLDQRSQAEWYFLFASRLHEARGDLREMGNDISALGVLCLRTAVEARAEKFFQEALQLYTMCGDERGCAGALRSLAEVSLMKGDVDDAEQKLFKALRIDHNAQSCLGLASDLVYLGEVSLRRERLDDAMQSFQSSLTFFQASGSVLGEASVHQRLGSLWQRMDTVDGAMTDGLTRGRTPADLAMQSFKTALSLHKAVRDRLGEADVHVEIGYLHRSEGRLNRAEIAFLKAGKLHHQAQKRLDEAHDIRNLAQIYMDMGSYDTRAEWLFLEARQMYRTIRISRTDADTSTRSRLDIRRGYLFSAETCFQVSASRRRILEDRLGEIRTLFCLGEYYTREGRFDEAEENLSEAIALCGSVNSRHAEMRGQQLIYNLWVKDVMAAQENDPDRATEIILQFENSYSSNDDGDAHFLDYGRLSHTISIAARAALIGTTVEKTREKGCRQHVFGREGRRVRRQGAKLSQLRQRRQLPADIPKLAVERVAVRRRRCGAGHVYEEIDWGGAFVLGRDIRASRNRFGEADSLAHLGKLNLRRDDLNGAEQSFLDALALHRIVQNYIGYANNLSNLGKVYLRKDDVYGAERAFLDALPLHRAVKDRLGEVNDLRNLGELHL